MRCRDYALIWLAVNRKRAKGGCGRRPGVHTAAATPDPIQWRHRPPGSRARRLLHEQSGLMFLFRSPPSCRQHTDAPVSIQLRRRTTIQHSPDPHVRASAGRIVDLLQQLVLVRPEMVIPLEEIVRKIANSVGVGGGTRRKERQVEPGAHGRTPLAPVPLDQWPELRALIEPPAVAGITPKRTAKPAERRKRR